MQEFFNDNPATPEGAQQLHKEKRNLRNFSTPITFLAGKLIRANTQGIKEVNDDVERSFHEGTEKDMANLIFHRTQRESTAVIFGASILGIEEAVATGKFSLGDVVSRIYTAFTGTLIELFPVPSIKVEAMTDESWWKLAAASREDPTFAAFFTDQKNFLPQSLREFIAANGALGSFLAAISEKWKPLAKAFIKEVNSEHQPSSYIQRGRILGEVVTEKLPADGRKLTEKEAMIKGDMSEDQINRLKALMSKITPGKD